MSRFRFLTALALVLLSLSFSPAAAAAQTGAPFPGAIRVGGDWIPCDHPIATKAGLSCRAPIPTIPEIPTPITPDAHDPCEDITPYHHPTLIEACRGKGGPPVGPFAFSLGRVYYRAYPSDRAVVLSITRSVEGAEVVTLQWVGTTLTGRVFALRMDEPIGPWIAVPRAPAP